MLYVFFLLPIKYQPIYFFERRKNTKKIISMQLREGIEMTINVENAVCVVALAYV